MAREWATELMYADKGWTLAPGRICEATARGQTRWVVEWGAGVEEGESSMKSTREEGDMEVVGGGRGGAIED
jgi:hypothetical protein